MAKGKNADNRRLTLASDVLEQGPFYVLRFTGEESFSHPGSFSADILSPQDHIDANKALGKKLTLSVRAGAATRHFSGHITRLVAGTWEGKLRQYRVDFAPWLWFLTRNACSRVFQNKTVQEIITEVFKKYGASFRYQFDLKTKLTPWENCVQYRETDFNFVSRLLEQEGLFYFFQHEADDHKLVIADNNLVYKSCLELSFAGQNIPLLGSLGAPPECNYGRDRPPGSDRITFWEHAYSLRSTGWKLSDYNPDKALSLTGGAGEGAAASTASPLGGPPAIIHDYPGEVETMDLAKADSLLRLQAEQAQANLASGAGTYAAFAPGGTFKLMGHPSRAETEPKYVVVAVRHQAGEPGPSDSELFGCDGYSNAFTCMPAAVPFHPPRLTPKPVIHGSQTALVVGPKGETIWPDAQGRVKVQFFWDTVAKGDETSSCWIRCSQAGGAKGGGSLFLPRVGQEVVVTYLDGDPDRPLITGTVYNGTQKPPHELPAKKTRSYIRTLSDGGTKSNEISFDDSKDKETLAFTAAKDLMIEVENDQTVTVKKGNQTTLVQKGNVTIKLDQGEHTIEASKGIVLKVGDNAIRIDRKGITIQALTIRLVGKVQVEVKGPMTQISSDGMLQLKGGIVTIN